jgi:hypothetical protein
VGARGDLDAALPHGRSAEVTVQGLVVVLLPDGNGPDGPTSASASTSAKVSWSRSTTTSPLRHACPSRSEAPRSSTGSWNPTLAVQ